MEEYSLRAIVEEQPWRAFLPSCFRRCDRDDVPTRLNDKKFEDETSSARRSRRRLHQVVHPAHSAQPEPEVPDYYDASYPRVDDAGRPLPTFQAFANTLVKVADQSGRPKKTGKRHYPVPDNLTVLLHSLDKF